MKFPYQNKGKSSYPCTSAVFEVQPSRSLGPSPLDFSCGKLKKPSFISSYSNDKKPPENYFICQAIHNRPGTFKIERQSKNGYVHAYIDSG
jgi:hypothetical protein